MESTGNWPGGAGEKLLYLSTASCTVYLKFGIGIHSQLYRGPRSSCGEVPRASSGSNSPKCSCPTRTVQHLYPHINQPSDLKRVKLIALCNVFLISFSNSYDRMLQSMTGRSSSSVGHLTCSLFWCVVCAVTFVRYSTWISFTDRILRSSYGWCRSAFHIIFLAFKTTIAQNKIVCIVFRHLMWIYTRTRLFPLFVETRISDLFENVILTIWGVMKTMHVSVCPLTRVVVAEIDMESLYKHTSSPSIST